MSSAMILWGACAVPIAWMAWRLLRPKHDETFGERGSILGGYREARDKYRGADDE